jgi:histone deacetylase 1/2
MSKEIKKKVAYYYHKDIGNYHYGNLHPMKPHRARMADSMIKSYGMDEYLTTMNPTEEFMQDFDMTKFHADDYVDFLK